MPAPRPTGQSTPQKTLLVKNTDGEPDLLFLINTSLKDNELAPAIQAAARDFLDTAEGKALLTANHGVFNYGDFAQTIPFRYCIRHGFTLTDVVTIMTSVDHDTNLAVSLPTEPMQSIEPTQEELKAAIFAAGRNAIEAVLDYELPDQEDADVIDRRLDMALEETSQHNFNLLIAQYLPDRLTSNTAAAILNQQYHMLMTKFAKAHMIDIPTFVHIMTLPGRLPGGACHLVFQGKILSRCMLDLKALTVYLDDKTTIPVTRLHQLLGDQVRIALYNA